MAELVEAVGGVEQARAFLEAIAQREAATHAAPAPTGPRMSATTARHRTERAHPALTATGGHTDDASRDHGRGRDPGGPDHAAPGGHRLPLPGGGRASRSRRPARPTGAAPGSRMQQRSRESSRSCAGPRRGTAPRTSDSPKPQQAAEDAKLSEEERIARRLAEAERRSAELEAELREQRLRSAVLAAAGRLSDEPEILLALLDRDAVEWAPDGTPKGLERQLKAIVEAHPKLARSAPDFGGGQRGATPAGTDMNAFIRRAAGRGT